MYSKNNVKMNAEKKAVKSPKYGLAKLSVGVASVLLGTTLVYGVNAQAADSVTPVTDQHQPATQTSSAASDDKAVTSADVEAASQAATEAKSAADAHQAVVSDAQSALEKAKSANSKVAVVNDALNSARAAESAEAQASGAVASANKALNEATEAYNTASDYNAQWENKYAKEWDQFKQKHAETVVALEKAQAAESAAQDDVNKMSADVTTQLGEVTKANAANLAAAQNLENVSKAGYKNTSEEYKAAQKLADEAKKASDDANAKLAEMQADLEGLKQRLDAAKAETKKQEQKIAYQLGKTGLTPEHKAMMDAKLKGYDVIKAATAKKNVAQAAYNTALAALAAAHAKTVEARAAYNQAKLDNDQPNATQLEQLRKNAEQAKTDYDAANAELNKIADQLGVTKAQNKVDQSKQNIKNAEGNITKAEEAVKNAQSALDAAKDKTANAQAVKDAAQKAFDAQPEDLKHGAKSYVNDKLKYAEDDLGKAQTDEGLKEEALNKAQNDLATLNLRKARYQKELANNQTKLDELKTNADYKNQVAKVADLKAKAEAANKKYNDADTFLKSTAELRMNLNRLQQAYENALAQQAQLDKSAKDAQTAYEELYAILNNGEKPSDQGKTDDNTNPGKDDQGKGDDTTNPGKDDQGKGDDTVTPGKDDQNKGDDQGTKTDDTKDNGSADANKGANDQKDDANKGASDVTLKGGAQVKLGASKALYKAAAQNAAQNNVSQPKHLPQTGNESAVAATGLGVAALVGMLGLAGASKRRA